MSSKQRGNSAHSASGGDVSCDEVCGCRDGGGRGGCDVGGLGGCGGGCGGCEGLDDGGEQPGAYTPYAPHASGHTVANGSVEARVVSRMALRMAFRVNGPKTERLAIVRAQTPASALPPLRATTELDSSPKSPAPLDNPAVQFSRKPRALIVATGLSVHGGRCGRCTCGDCGD